MIENLQTILKSVLQSCDDIWANEEKTELAHNLLLNKLEQHNPEILALLLKNDELKRHFFMDIDGILIFKQADFQFFLSQNKVSHSYTKYKNRIGLTDGSRFLKDSTDVVLDFPFKDCVLNGGQSSEESEETYFERNNDAQLSSAQLSSAQLSSAQLSSAQLYTKKTRKRQEIFFNQVLAFDEIDRLFDPKALSKFTRYNAQGQQPVNQIKRHSDGTIAENLIIKGNNLITLHSLATQFRNKVKLIYIDPPYNTGNDGFKYNDKFNHSTWLTFMKNRLEIARELLRDDGVIFVQCDDNEQAYIKILMDEIFDRENFINAITLKMSTPSGTKMSHINKKIIKTKEYILCYSKNKDYILFNPQYEIKDSYDWEYGFFLEKNNSENIEDWNVRKLTDVLLENSIILNKNSLPNMDKKEFKDFYLKSSHLIWARGRHHNIPKDIYEKSQKNKDKIFEYQNGIETQYAYRGRRLAFLNKTIKKCVDKTGTPTVDISQAICDFWDFIKTSKLFAEGDVEFSNGKKPELIIKTLIDMTTQEGDIVLDYHLGSGTTAAVAHKMNRQYIGIEQMDYIETLSAERLKKVIEGEQGGISKAVNWQGGGNFVYFELAQFNQTAKDLIQHCEDFTQLRPLFEQLCEQYFLKHNLNIEQFSKIMQEAEFQQLSLDEQKQMMLEMLDLNQLYVNLSDIEDEQFAACLSDEDRELNQQFYGVK